MIQSWILVLAVVPVLLVSLLYPQKIGDRLGLALMLPVVLLTLWSYMEWHWLPLVEIVHYLVLGIGGGVLLFLLGLPISGVAPASYLRQCALGARRVQMDAAFASLLLYQTLIILYEELIWRVFLVNVLQAWLPLYAVIVLPALLFWFSHIENRERGLHSLEFLLFSLVLTAVYAYSRSLLLVCLLHATRNILIILNQVAAEDAAEESNLKDERLH